MSLFPKVLWPFRYLTLTQNKPSEFFECYLLFGHFCLTMIDELHIYMPYIPMQIKPNKSLSRQRMGLALTFSERAHMSSLFLRRISVDRVNLSRLVHNTADTAGQCPHQDPTRQGACRRQPSKVCLSHRCFSLSLHLCLPPSLSSLSKINGNMSPGKNLKN